MKYAIGSRINFIQLDTQFSYEMDKFLSEYAGINSSKYHRALSVLLQIYMRAGNTAGYFLPAEEDDILDDARRFNIGRAELKAIYDVTTKRGVFDKELYEKYHIITNNNLQISYISAKYRNVDWQMDGKYILDFVYKKYKNDTKTQKIASKLEEFIGKYQSIEANGIVKNGIEKNSIVLNSNLEVVDIDDMTLDEFKQKHPNKCLTLPTDWVKPHGVSLRIISEAIERSTKFLQVKPFMSLQKLATVHYEKLCDGQYDDSTYTKNESKNQQNKFQQGLDVAARALEGIPDEE